MIPEAEHRFRKITKSVQLPPEWVFGLNRKWCSASFGMGVRDRPEYAYGANLCDMIGGSNDLVRLAEIIKRLGPDACEVLMALCRSMHGSNTDT